MSLLMANNNFFKFFFLLFSLALLSANPVFGQAPPPVTETVTVSAQVDGAAAPGGGISGGLAIPRTAVRFSGEAYPYATVSFLKAGAPAGEVLADSLGKFSATLEEKYDSTILYTLFAHDAAGAKSLLINYPLVVYSGYLTHLSGIRFAPTILTDRAQVKAGDYLTVSGYALPNKSLEVAIIPRVPLGSQAEVFTLSSEPSGYYKIVLPLSRLPKGDYTVHISYPSDARKSRLVKFTIGDVNIPSAELSQNIPGDCNADSKIDLVDFSVLAFWYGKPNPPRCVDANDDGIINLVDFSILAFWWTG